MNPKIINSLLIVTSLIGYLEWGGNNALFLFQAEWEIISIFFHDPISVIHPFTLLPILGQTALFVTLFQNQPNKKLTLFGVLGLGILMLFMFIIGCISLNYKILFSTIPFLVVVFFAIRDMRNKKKIARK